MGPDTDPTPSALRGVRSAVWTTFSLLTPRSFPKPRAASRCYQQSRLHKRSVLGCWSLYRDSHLCALSTETFDIAGREYSTWSREVDQPTLRGLGQVADFRVFTTAALDGSNETYSIVEVIDVDSLAAWQEIVNLPAMKALGPAFERFVDLSSVSILHGEEIRHAIASA